jgi:hypothetical protein
MKRGSDTGNQDSAEKRGVSEETGKEEKQRSTSGNEIRDSADDTGYPGRFQRSSGKNREDENLKSISQTDDSDKDLHALQQEEISGSEEEDIRSANYSDTDEDENEGLGDGKLGRTVRRGLEE